MFILLDKLRNRFNQWLKRKTTMDFSDWSVFVLFILGLFTIFYLGGDVDLPNRISNIVLWFTAIAILQYTKETYWLKQISQKQLRYQRESNLRPVILRSGWLKKWEDIKFSIKDGQLEGVPLQFAILKNIAKDIRGHIVIGKNKYELLFANEISQINVKDSTVSVSDLEKKIMLYLYEVYYRTKSNSRWKISDAYRELGVKEGTYVGVLNDSKYIKTSGEEFQLTDEGIRLMDTEKPKAFQFLPVWGWMKADTIINAIYQESKFEMTNEENSIYLTYQDIGNNKYFTRENTDFSQSSGKLKL
ncbi:hypothetical protein D4R52_03625 [bacterium]|nr:MAG: hypothetical protein D4R52_03625 [bacterium]